MQTKLNFISNFIKKPLETGAIAPSSRSLTSKMTKTADIENKKCIVELGPGTGVFTKEILSKISPECLFFALEINKKFVQETKRNCPEAIIYHASAVETKKYLLKHGRTSCDCIISSLPWIAFNEKLQIEILKEAYDSLTVGGIFLTFSYVHGKVLKSYRKFNKLLESTFSKVEKSEIIWKNLPPAFVYYCEK